MENVIPWVLLNAIWTPETHRLACVIMMTAYVLAPYRCQVIIDTMLTLQWLKNIRMANASYYVIYITVLKHILSGRGREAGNPLVSLLLPGSFSQAIMLHGTYRYCPKYSVLSITLPVCTHHIAHLVMEGEIEGLLWVQKPAYTYSTLVLPNCIPCRVILDRDMWRINTHTHAHTGGFPNNLWW